MKQISLDFKNRMLAIRTNEQDGTEIMWEDIQKTILLQFIRKDIYMSGDNFTFDFEKEIVSVNRSVKYDGADGAIYTVDMFIPVKEYSLPGLSERFNEMIDKLGYAEVQWNEREMDYLNTLGFFNNMFHGSNMN